METEIIMNNNRNEALLQKMIMDVRRRVAIEMPDEGDFQTIEEAFENTDDSVNLTHISLRVVMLPKRMEDSDVERYMELAGYKYPSPYMSTRSVIFGRKPEILAKLDEEQLVQQLLYLIPKLADDLQDF